MRCESGCCNREKHDKNWRVIWGAEETRGEGGVPSSGQLEQVASFGGLKSGPTHANRFGFSALFAELRTGIRTRQGEHTCARKHCGTAVDWRKGSARGIRLGG